MTEKRRRERERAGLKRSRYLVHYKNDTHMWVEGSAGESQIEINAEW